MVKVQLVYTKSCVYCPIAKAMFRDLKKQYKFDYEEIDATSPEGQKLVAKYSIMAVPTIIVDNVVKWVGVPQKDKVIAVLGK
ncbi:MAG: thioredoxin family protein [Candidatus Aenigmatarchaeota archaeon]|nr:thioredoxin family protein [Candidatus Aenigmarchaeota archaeon]